MKLGIVTYRQYPYVSANTSIGYSIGDAISKKYNYEVVYIGIKQDEKQTNISSYNSHKICYLNKKIDKDNALKVKNIFKRYISENLFLGSKARELKQIVKNEQIDALICVIAPFEDARIVRRAKLNIPCFLYQLDPYYNLNDYVNNKKRREFIDVLNSFDYLFTTDLLTNEYKNDKLFEKYLDRIQTVEFPLLENVGLNNSISKNNEKIRLLYAGSFYHDIRNPQILVNLKKCLNDDFEIVFCGSCDLEEDQKLLEASGIVCKGRLTPEELNKEIENVNVLINIGNTVRNQMGSKIISYIATGKPILNIMQFDTCPTISCLEQYRYKLNVLTTDINNNKDNIMSFLKENKDSFEAYDVLIKKYEKYTANFVASEFMKVLK